MEKYKEILRYQKAGLSQRQTASVMGISRNTVAKVIQEASARQVTCAQVKTQTETEIKELLFLQTESTDFQRKPDFESLSQELRKPGVTHGRNMFGTRSLPIKFPSNIHGFVSILTPH